MNQGGYKIRNKAEIHFLSFAVVVPIVPMAIGIGRVDVFTRKEYRDILIDSLKFCQESKGLLLAGVL
jgi:hypothetical protein